MAGAVERNRVKRLLREGFRTLRPSLPKDCDLVANAKRSAKGASFSQVMDDLRSVAHRLALEGYPISVRGPKG
jgi:ribonuclease P protein component